MSISRRDMMAIGGLTLGGMAWARSGSFAQDPEDIDRGEIFFGDLSLDLRFRAVAATDDFLEIVWLDDVAAQYKPPDGETPKADMEVLRRMKQHMVRNLGMVQSHSKWILPTIADRGPAFAAAATYAIRGYPKNNPQPLDVENKIDQIGGIVKVMETRIPVISDERPGFEDGDANPRIARSSLRCELLAGGLATVLIAQQWFAAKALIAKMNTYGCFEPPKDA